MTFSGLFAPSFAPRARPSIEAVSSVQRLSHRAMGGLALPQSGLATAHRALASFDRFSCPQARRVVVKIRIVKLAGLGLGAAGAHLRYIRRDVVTRESEREACRLHGIGRSKL